MAKTNVQDRKKLGKPHAFIDSAQRTLDAGASGVAAIGTAMRGELGNTFIAAVDRIRAAKGRVIVTGMGKSGHVARKIAAYQRHRVKHSDATVRPTLPPPTASGRSSLQPERPKHPVQYTNE